MPERALLDPAVFRRVILQAALLPVIALILAAALLVAQIRELVQSHEEVHRFDESVALAYYALKVEVDEQTGLRGYVATGRPEFLKPYTEGKQAFDDTIRELRGRVQPRDLPLLQELVALDNTWDVYAEEVIARKRAGADAAGMIGSGRGEAIINTIRQRIRALVRSLENDRDGVSAAATRRARSVTATIIVGAIAAGLVLGILVRRAFRRVTRAYEVALQQQIEMRARAENESMERQRAEEEVRRINATLEERIEQRTAELKETNRELEAFAYSVSHDLRAPIRHMSGFAELLSTKTETRFDEKGQRYLGLIIDAGRDAGKLVDDLLAFSRMGRVEMKKEKVDVAAIVSSVQQELALDQQDRDVEWKIGPLPTVEADRPMLRLVLYNLMSNALKYTNRVPKAVIEIDSSSSADEDIIAIRDNGVGFDMRYAGKLFGVFQRLHDSRDFEGTGIGLASVRRIIARHGGRVWAEGKPGEGAMFYFTIPRIQNEPRQFVRPAAERVSSGNARGALA